MGRDCIQLLDTGRTDASAGIELVWVESLLQFPTVDEAESAPDIAAMACVLVNLAPSTQSSERFALLAASMRGVRIRHERFPGEEPLTALAAALRQRDDDFMTVVLLLDDSSKDLGHAQKVLDALRSKEQDTTGLVVAVSNDPDAWASLQGIDGFVHADLGKGTSVASQLFTALASRTAPFVWSCLDDEDIRPALGSAANPSKIVEVVWFEERRQLIFTSDADEQTFQQSANVVAFMFAGDTQIGSTKGALKAFRSVAADEQSLVYLVPVNFLVNTMTNGRRLPVTLVCWQH